MEWKISDSLVPYPDALAFMEQRVADIRTDEVQECVWLLEHPPLYTGGTSAKAEGLIGGNDFLIYNTGRGGEYTYHGPGQRIAYVMLDLKSESRNRNPDIRWYVQQLEQWMITTLAVLGVEGFTREGRIGVWTNTSSGEAKIAALGIRVRKWVSFHGIALNVCPDLSHYNGIIPCGISEYGVTSLAALGVEVSMAQVDAVLKESFEKVFGG